VTFDIIISLDGRYFAVEMNGGGTYSPEGPMVQPLSIIYMGTGEAIGSAAYVNSNDKLRLRDNAFRTDLRALYRIIKGTPAGPSDFTFIQGEELTYEN
jgi:hypothetical protein